MRLHDVLSDYLKHCVDDDQLASLHRRLLEGYRQGLPPIRDGGQRTAWWDLGEDATDAKLSFELPGCCQVVGWDLHARLRPDRPRRGLRAGHEPQWWPLRDGGLGAGRKLGQRLGHGEQRMSRPRRIRKRRPGSAQKPYAPL